MCNIKILLAFIDYIFLVCLIEEPVTIKAIGYMSKFKPKHLKCEQKL